MTSARTRLLRSGVLGRDFRSASCALVRDVPLMCSLPVLRTYSDSSRLWRKLLVQVDAERRLVESRHVVRMSIHVDAERRLTDGRCSVPRR